MAPTSNKSTFYYELVGMIFVIILGSVLHFTFEWSGSQPIVGLFSAINESVWEHLKLAFWPALLFALIEHPMVKKMVNNFAFAKTIGICLVVIIIPIIFYSYISVTGKSIFVIDISSFVVAVVIGQLSSYKLLMQKASRKPQQHFPDCASSIRTCLCTVYLLSASTADFQRSNHRIMRPLLEQARDKQYICGITPQVYG